MLVPQESLVKGQDPKKVLPVGNFCLSICDRCRSICQCMIRAWCEQNRNRCYIPEWLLKKWGITVDLNFGAVA